MDLQTSHTRLTSLHHSKFYLAYLQLREQDGPSLESSSYFNVGLRILGPWDPGTLGPLYLGTLGPRDSWTSSLLQHLLIIPLTSSYLLLSLPPTLLLWYGLVRGGWGYVPSTFSSSNLLPPPSYSSQLLHLLPNLLLTPHNSSRRFSDD